MSKISILVPCYNEENVLGIFYSELISVINHLDSYDWELLFIDDGSCDKTLNIIKSLRSVDDRVSYVALSRNFGKEAAMLAGFDYVTGDCVIIMDADLQDPPKLIPKMIEKWEQGYDDVYAKQAYK